MNFFEHQREAKKKTAVMAFCFFLCYIATAAALAYVLMISLSFFSGARWDIFWWGFGGFLFYSLLTVYLKWLEIRDNPVEFLTRQTGAQKTNAENDFYSKRFQNIVDEMSIASGVPRPALRIIPRDTSINAFAVGFDVHSSGIFITEGALKGLNREETQAVVAHEFSHILNGDMQSNTIMIALTEGLENFSVAAFDLSRARISRKGGYSIFHLVSLIMGIIGYVGWFLAALIKSLFSQQKEYLADASSVQFTRNADAMTSVLEKIMLLEERGMALSARTPSQVAHMTFSESLSSPLTLSSHPPTLKRIQRIKPNYNHQRSIVSARKKADFNLYFPFDGLAEDIAMGFSGAPATGISEILPVSANASGNSAKQFILMNQGIETVEEKIKKILPLQDVINLKDPQVGLFALVLNSKAAQQKNQLDIIQKTYSPKLAQDVFELGQKIQKMSTLEHASILITNLDKVRDFSKDDFLIFAKCSEAIFDNMGGAKETEKSYQMILKCQLNELANPRAKTFGNWSLGEAREDLERALWFLCQGSKNPESAFQAAWAKTGRRTQKPPVLRVGWGTFEQSSLRLNNLTISAKQKLIEAATAAICHDKRYSPEEILRMQCLCFAIRSPAVALPSRTEDVTL